MIYKIKELEHDEIKNLIGINDANIKLLEELYGCDIAFRDDCFMFLDDDEKRFSRFCKHLDVLCTLAIAKEISYDVIKQTYIDIEEDHDNSYSSEIIGYSFSGKPYHAKTYNQHQFISLIRNNDLTFAVGPAGTGKTFLAVLMAVNALKKNDVKKIIITRPAVEAGESLGFLPGDLKEKIDPYLMPIYDALDEILGMEVKNKYIEKGIIEVMPLAYMRGRTLNEAFVILDEAQNTTDKQMLMFLTRLGFNSKMVVNGDITQIDLNIAKCNSGLVTAMKKLKDTKNIGFMEFSNNDVVRNPLVLTIIERFK